MIDIGTANEASLTSAQQRLFPVIGTVAEMIFKSVREGKIKSSECRHDGKTEYVFFYSKNEQGFLYVHASAFVGGGNPDPWLWCLGADLLARQERARGIMCSTARRGHVEQCVRTGYKVTGVELTKIYENASA